MSDLLQEIREQIATGKQREVARKAEVDEAVISRMLNGKAGLTVKSARGVAGVLDRGAAALYMTTQAGAIALKRAAGEISDGQVLEQVGRVLKGFDDFTQEELAVDADTTKNAISTLDDLVSSAKKGSTSMERLGRTSGGLKANKRYATEPNRRDGRRTATKASRAGLDRLGRKPDGTRPRKVV